MLGTMMDYPLTLPAMLERAGRLFPEREVVSRRPDRSLHRTRYAAIAERARALAEALQRAGLERGQRVATLMWNHDAHLEAYFGIPAAGGVLHTLNFRLHPNDIGYIVGHAEDRFLIVDDVLLPLLAKIPGRERIQRTFVVAHTGRPVPDGLESHEAFLETAKGDFAYPDLDENEAAGMCYTSGTTGRPKGVVYSHRALVLHSLALSLTDTVALSHRDAIMPVVPMFHVNAWGLPFAATMLGAKQVMPGPHLDPESLLDLCEREQVSLACGVPTIWLGILQALDAEPGRWKLDPGLRTVVGGAAVPEALLRGFDAHGIRTIQGWGMTETTPVGTISWLKAHLAEAPEDARYRTRAKQGLALPFVEMRVMNEKGEAPWDGESMGELEVRGPWVAASYYREGEEAADRWSEDGWFRTGDVATIDAEGYMKITDRIKDLIKSGGEWISSVDLENALMGHPAVKEAAVIAVPHPKWQERPLAVVVLNEGAEARPDELIAHLEGRFAEWWMPDGVAFVDAIPRTSAGKFRKAELRERFRGWHEGT